MNFRIQHLLSRLPFGDRFGCPWGINMRGPIVHLCGWLLVAAALPGAGYAAPTYTVNAAVVTAKLVTLNAIINPNGSAGPVTSRKGVIVSWQYGLAAGSYTKITATQGIGTGVSDVSVSFPLANRSLAATIYHYQLIVTSNLGTIYGPDQTFSVASPTVTYPPPEVTGSSATLLPTVNPNELAVSVYIEYGLTTAYSSGTTSQVLSSGTTPVPVEADLAGLVPDTAYHYRVVTTNVLSTVYGPDEMFATQPMYGTAVTLLSKSAAPGIAGAAFNALGNPAINDLDHIAFQATVTGGSGSGMTTANNSGIWADIGTNGLTLIAQTGTSAPGYTPGSNVGTFATLSDPVYSDSDAVAFIGTLSGSGAANATVTKSNNTGIWATTSGLLLLVARTGDLAPDANGTRSSSGPVFASFQQFSLPDQGGVVILANLVSGRPGPGGVVPGNTQGIWAVDTAGTLKQIIRTGESLAVNGLAKTLSSLSIFNVPSASAGQTRHFNNPGDLIYKVTFTDGSPGIVQSVFP